MADKSQPVIIIALYRARKRDKNKFVQPHLHLIREYVIKADVLAFQSIYKKHRWKKAVMINKIKAKHI